MKIAVVSDSHDNIWNMKKAVWQANDAGADLMIHCGDLISPFMLEELDAFRGHIHLILGNNSGDQILLMKRLASRRKHITFHGWHGRIEAGGLNLGFVHAPEIACSMARSGEFDMVFFGHTHIWKMDKVDSTVLLNPGEIMGKKEPAGWALVDTADRSARHIFTDMQDTCCQNHTETETKRMSDAEQPLETTSIPHGECAEMLLHVRPDLYRACMRCIWMLIHEKGLTPVEAQNCLIEEFLRHHGC